MKERHRPSEPQASREHRITRPHPADCDIRFTLGQIEHARGRVQQDAHFGMHSMQAFNGGNQAIELRIELVW